MSQSHQRTAIIGECLIELTPKNGKDFSLNFAGDTLNTAVYLVRSLSKTTMLTVDYVTALGAAMLSHEMLNQKALEFPWSAKSPTSCRDYI